MKIAIINVSIRPNARVKYFPVGLGYVMTAIEKAGYEFDYIDQDLYDLSEDKVLELLGEKYDIVLFGCIVTGYKYVKSLAGKIKEQSSKTIIAVGNSVATSIPEELLNNTSVDVAFLGEGEETDVEFIKIIEEGKDWSQVKGIAYKNNAGEIVYTEKRDVVKDISEFKINFKLFDMEKYIPYMNMGVPRPRPVSDDKLRACPINTARGCINKCTFCYHVFRNECYRHRSMSAVMDDIEYVMNEYGINYIFFWDDLTFYNKRIIQEFLDEKERRGLVFFWDASCRGNLFTEDSDMMLIKRMKDNGCVSMGFSLESSNVDILKAMRKNVKVEEFKKQTKLLRSGGVEIGTSIVVGYPQETKETIENTFDVCIECGVVPSVGYLLPQPGSEMYDYARENGYINNVEEYLLALGDRQDLRLNMTKMSNEELEKIVEDNIRRCNKALEVECITDNLLKTQNNYHVTKK